MTPPRHSAGPTRRPRVRVAAFVAFVTLASVPLLIGSPASAQTAPSLTITSPSGAQVADTEFDVKVKLTAQPSHNVRVRLTWSQNYMKPASGQNNGSLQLSFSPGNWNTEQTLKFVPSVGEGSYKIDRNFETNLIFQAYELIPNEYEWCDQLFGETRDDARANGKCWTATRLWKGPVQTQWATITVAPDAPAIWPHDVKVVGDPLNVPVTDGGAPRFYELTLNLRRAAGKTYTVTPRVEARSGHTLPEGVTITPASHSWTAGSPNTVRFTVVAADDDDIVDHPYKIVHDLSGDFTWRVNNRSPAASRSPAALQISTMVRDDDQNFEPVFKDKDGDVIDASNPIQLPAGRAYRSGDDIYVTVELSQQVGAIVTLKTQHNERTTYTLLTNRPHDVDLSTDTPNLCSGIAVEGVFYVNDGTPQNPILVPVCRMTHTHEEEPFTVSATNFTDSRSSYHSSQLRFTTANWNQPQRVNLRVTGNVAEGQTAELRYAISNRATGSVPVEFVDPADLELAPNPTPVITISSSGGDRITEGGTAYFVITANPPPTSPITVNIGVTETGQFGANGAVTVAITRARTEYAITTSDDETDEDDGSVAATVQTGSGYTVGGTASSATVEVTDDDAPEPDSESNGIPQDSSTGTSEQTADQVPEPPLEKYAALVKSFYDRITARSGHGDGPAGGWNKRFLKAMGHPEYVDYPQDAVTAARAQELYDHGGPGANTAWAGTVEAINYANNYTPPTPTPSPTPTPTPTPTPVVSISGGSDVVEGAAVSFTLSVSPAPTAALPVTVAITSSGAYGVSTGSQTVTVPTSGTKAFTVATTGDDVDEPDGSVTATVGGGADYDVGAASTATVAVADDDDPPPPTPVDDPKPGLITAVEKLRSDYSEYADWATGTFDQYMIHYGAGEVLGLLNSDAPVANNTSNQALFFRAIRAAKGAGDSTAVTLFGEVRDYFGIRKIG